MHKAVSRGSTGARRGTMDNTIEVEAYQALLARAHRKTGAVPPELVVRHILAVTARGDWPAQVRWVDGTPGAGLRRWLRPAKTGGWTLEVPGSPGRRRQVVEELLGALGDGRGEPALYALLQEDRRRIARASQGARDLDRLKEALRTLKQRLYPYQREAVERFLSRGRLLLADDMGLGKTAQAS